MVIRSCRSAFCWSSPRRCYRGIDPHDRATWALEVAPAVIALPILWFTRRRFPLTPLLYVLVFVHALVLIYGGAYTYARVPLGFEIQAWFDLERNPYDKIGHLFQGLVPALLAREILVRGDFARGSWMVGFLAICVAMTVSAVYELVEWAVAVVAGGGGIARGTKQEGRAPGKNPPYVKFPPSVRLRYFCSWRAMSMAA
ncbi:MAG: DUF2238 domain-containing protein [Guyparkeria sp.]